MRPLKWSDIDDKGGFIHVRNSKTGQARVVPLEDEAREALKLLNRRTTLVFCDKEGKKFKVDRFLKPLQSAAVKAGIKKRIDLHTLRHSFGSNKIRQGWGLKKVSMILGHADITMTAKVYTHLLDGDLKVRDEFSSDNSSRQKNNPGGLQNADLASSLMLESATDSATLRSLGARSSVGLERQPPKLKVDRSIRFGHTIVTS